MCSPSDPTYENTPRVQINGSACPACGAAGSPLDYMIFMDPHGVERVDREVFTCAEGVHVFRLKADGRLRLVAERGVRVHPARDYSVLAPSRGQGGIGAQG
jgi:hypothetical protein